ncbi:hypothetical protein F2P56_018733 [Juglans regia]|uniref:Retrovirus-related Pol polyprotein from transposon TNT 1-94-like beta-barrel domain-containing protein n=1 Tax=Juglans regia TaxID=51240 RepID=A0A833UYP3_JUGRE|nr:hypothetical protein F2P56_018733 [Juglans regia]
MKFHSNEVTANCATSSHGKNKKWLIDSAASHNMTTDLSNLSIHSEYDGTDEVVIGDGSGLPISHVGSLSFISSNRVFHLRDTLCVPTIQKNLVSVHNFTKHNNVYLEFHPLYFLVKDRITGATLLKGECEDGVYPLPESMEMASKKVVAYVHERTSPDERPILSMEEGTMSTPLKVHKENIREAIDDQQQSIHSIMDSTVKDGSQFFKSASLRKSGWVLQLIHQGGDGNGGNNQYEGMKEILMNSKMRLKNLLDFSQTEVVITKLT